MRERCRCRSECPVVVSVVTEVVSVCASSVFPLCSVGEARKRRGEASREQKARDGTDQGVDSNGTGASLRKRSCGSVLQSKSVERSGRKGAERAEEEVTFYGMLTTFYVSTRGYVSVLKGCDRERDRMHLPISSSVVLLCTY